MVKKEKLIAKAAAMTGVDEKEVEHVYLALVSIIINEMSGSEDDGEQLHKVYEIVKNNPVYSEQLF